MAMKSTPTLASSPSATPPATWKSMTSGTLMILAGITAMVAEIIYFTTGDLGIFAGVPFVESSANLKGALLAAGLIAIAGGICTLQRRMFWLAVVGVVCSMSFTIWPVLVIGIIAIVLLAASRREFRRTRIG